VNDERTRLLARVRAALAPLATRAALPEYPDEMVFARTSGSAASFLDALARAGGRSFTDAGALGAWLAGRGCARGYCDPVLLPSLAAALPAGLALETRFARDRVDDYSFAITRASAAIAETGTIVLDDALTPRRLAAIAPWIHVAVVREPTIHPRVIDAIRALGSPRLSPYVVWCTGPSKTADVEGILIEGVHGPGEQVALVLA
jgi:L-lactate dehydrogenase complex protein LldG